MADWNVLKFGGTSVSTRDRWDTIASVIASKTSEGHRPLIVCSAISGVSNALERLLEEAVAGQHEDTLAHIIEKHHALAAELELDVEETIGEDLDDLRRLALGASLTNEVSPRLHARVMAMGELMLTKLGAKFLEDRGLSVQWADAREMLRALPDVGANEHRHFLSAACDFEPDPELRERLENLDAQAVLTQGFIAHDDEDNTVLLGRGGSDTSAAYLAAKLQAKCLEIWTDVPGMYTANPRAVPAARLLKALMYDEAQEIATMGGKVLHPRCIDPVRRYEIPLAIRCTQLPEIEGTYISNETPDFGAQVKAISAKTGVLLVSMDTVGMWQQVGFLADAFAAFKRNGLSVDLVATSETNVTVSVDPIANALDAATINALLRDLRESCNARVIGPCAAVSLVGHNIRAILHQLGPALEAFEEQKIYLVSQAASDLNLTFVVDEEQADKLVTKLHAMIFHERIGDNLLGPTWKELFEEEQAPQAGPRPWWRRKRKKLLEIGEQQGPVYVYDQETLNQRVGEVQALPVDRVFYAIKANPNPAILRNFHRAGVGFECVSPGEIDHVRRLFPDLEPERILFTPNFAPRSEYEHGFEVGAFVTLDNLHPLERWPQVFEGRSVLVRVDPGHGRGHHRFVRTAGPESKFGVSPGELDRLFELAEKHDVTIVGLHAHVGSGIRDAETWAETAVFLARLAGDLETVRYLNVGGGLGVPEKPGQRRLNLEAVRRSMETFRAAHPDFELWMEPGRYLVAEAGVLLARVTQTKTKGEAAYVGLDTGMNSLIRPALYGSYHRIVNLTRIDERAEIVADVVGPICETGDVLGHKRRLPKTSEGDVMLLATAGAYGRAMSSEYNLRKPANEFFLE